VQVTRRKAVASILACDQRRARGPAEREDSGRVLQRRRVRDRRDVARLRTGDPETRGAFGKELLDEWVSYVAYLAAFGTIGVLWLVHHATFARIRQVDTGALWRNLMLLLSASLFPFPTAVIASAFRNGDGTDQAASVVLYAVVGMLSGAAWLLFITYLRSRPCCSRPMPRSTPPGSRGRY
jgi:hypothetical protein